MNYNCEKVFVKNFNNLCCFHHFLILQSIADQHYMHDQFAELLLSNVNKFYDLINMLKDITHKEGKNLTKSILTIINSYIVYFYNINQHEKAKYLYKNALKISSNKYEDPDILGVKSDILCNIACVYEKETSYIKARELFEKAHYFSQNEINSTIIQNNLTKVYWKIGLENFSIETNFAVYVSCLDILNKEILDDVEKECLCNIIFNCCCFIKKDFKEGLNISTALLGKDHYITQKFSLKCQGMYYFNKNQIKEDKDEKRIFF